MLILNKKENYRKILMINEDEKRRLSEGIEILIGLQKKFQEEHGYDHWRKSPDKKREMFVRTLFAAISELGEAGDEVNKWWKKGCREPESIDLKREEVLEEMIDALHFFLSALIILDADGREVADTYLRKLGINFERQKQKKLGYI